MDDALPAEMLCAARADCSALVADGTFTNTDQHDASVRSDQVFWIEEPDGSWMTFGADRRRGLLDVLRAVRTLAVTLERHSGGDANESQFGVPRKAQLARYTPVSNAVPSDDASEEVASAAVIRATGGARYTAHRDGLPLSAVTVPLLLTNPGVCMRETTVIVYLTAPATTWPGSEGTSSRTIVAGSAPPRPGSLVLYLGAAPDDTVGSTATRVVEVLPLSGRAVLFDSRTVLHEVCPNTRTDLERLALTVWIGGAHDLSGLVSMMRAWWCSASGPRRGWSKFSPF